MSAMHRKSAHSASAHMIGRARLLRGNATEEERRLRYRLRLMRKLGFHFRRQSPFGRYILDFVCHAMKTVVELDGSQHAMPEHAARDAERDRFLSDRGYRTIRLANYHVRENADDVADYIVKQLGGAPIGKING